MISTKQRSNLRAKANKLKPLVYVGKEGLTKTVLEEIELALFHNELVKVSVFETAGLETKSALNFVCEALSCEPVQAVGGKFIVYKKSSKKDIEHISLD